MSTKTMQGQLWSVAPQYWSKHFEPYFMPMYREVLQRVPISEQTMLLDAGCGSGLFTYLAIETGAQVLGVDAAPGLLEVARLRNPRNNFMEEDLESLPFSKNSFDVVTAFNSYQYAGSFENALAEGKRVLKEDGKLVIGIWDKPEKSDGTEILKAISSLLPAPPPGTPGPFALSEDGKIEEICARQGLAVKQKLNVTCPMLFHSRVDAVKAFMGTGPAAIAMTQHERKKVEGTIERAFEKFRLTEDMFYLQNQFLLFIIEK